MKALIYQGPHQVTPADRPPLRPAAGQALLAVDYVGICGTDLAIFAGKHPRAQAPLIMGHELEGRILELPPSAPSGLYLGQRVTVYPLLSCGQCYACRMGQQHVCQRLRLLGIDADGGFAETMLAPVSALHPLPDQLPAPLGALVEPLAVAVHAVRLSRMRVGDNVLITGAGPIGVLLALVAQAAGAGRVLLTEITSQRLALARDLGLHVLPADRPDLETAVRAELGGRGADVLFEATGHASVAPLLLQLVRIRGQIVQVGVFKQPAALDLQTLNFHEVSLIGSRVYTKDDFDRAVHLAAGKQIALDRFPVRRFPLSQAVAAFEAAQRGTTLKVLFEVQS